MRNYKYVYQFKDKKVEPLIIKKALDYSWRYTPSKNNFMNYNVHVLGPNQSDLRESLYYKCLANQHRANDSKFTNLIEYDNYLTEINLRPAFRNILTAPYILIYTQRVETQLNEHQQYNMSKGIVFEQIFAPGTKKHHAAKQNATMESGMFSINFGTKCLEHGVDICYIGCMPRDLKDWSEPEWSFITDSPIVIQLAGYGDKYKKDVIDPDTDLKPDFERVVNIL